MIYIECPNKMTEESQQQPSLFMAGGITGCGDWQSEMAEKLKYENVTLLNPRRKNFDVNDPKMEQDQIKWEYDYLSICDAVSFWFTPDTLQPITLFELGTFCPSEPEANQDFNVYRWVFVGVHPDYKKIKDVKIQIGLRRNDIDLVFDFDKLISQIKEWCRMY